MRDDQAAAEEHPRKICLRRRPRTGDRDYGLFLPVAAFSAQRRQSDAGGLEAAVHAQHLSGDVARAVAAQEEDRFGEFFFQAIAIERNGVVIIGADRRGVGTIMRLEIRRLWLQAALVAERFVLFKVDGKNK